MFIKRCIHWFTALVLLSVALLPASVAFAQPLTSVHIAGKATGFLPYPCNCVVDIEIAVNALGSPTSLEGAGVNHASTGVTNLFPLSGSTTDGIVVLSGTIIKSTGPVTGSPVRVEANAATGALRFTLGPIAGGLFTGKTIVFDGSARTTIVGE